MDESVAAAGYWIREQDRSIDSLSVAAVYRQTIRSILISHENMSRHENSTPNEVMMNSMVICYNK